MDVTTIIPLSSNVRDEDIRIVLDHHRGKCRNVVISTIHDEIFNLSKARNLGAVRCKSKWLLFCDADVVYKKNIQEMLDIGQPVVRGVYRSDVQDINETNPKYKCANSPILVLREMFETVGGYCESYRGWGYEDSDFEHKLPVTPYDFDANALHIIPIHNIISGNKGWDRGSDKNHQLFLDRMKMSIESRIEQDRTSLQKRRSVQ